MKIISEISSTKSEVKKSTFLAFLCPINEFKNTLESLKIEHPKAVHFVWAKRYLNEFNQIIEDKSDDNEPKNTSAMPCLNALRGADLINISVIVVRYFGGIKLGTGGLVRAYGGAVNLAINEALAKNILLDFELKKSLNLSIDIKNYNKFEYFLLKFGFEFEKSFEASSVSLKLRANEAQERELMGFLKEFKPSEFKLNE